MSHLILTIKRDSASETFLLPKDESEYSTGHTWKNLLADQTIPLLFLAIVSIPNQKAQIYEGTWVYKELMQNRFTEDPATNASFEKVEFVYRKTFELSDKGNILIKDSPFYPLEQLPAWMQNCTNPLASKEDILFFRQVLADACNPLNSSFKAADQFIMSSHLLPDIHEAPRIPSPFQKERTISTPNRTLMTDEGVRFCICSARNSHSTALLTLSRLYSGYWSLLPKRKGDPTKWLIPAILQIKRPCTPTTPSNRMSPFPAHFFEPSEKSEPNQPGSSTNSCLKKSELEIPLRQ